MLLDCLCVALGGLFTYFVFRQTLKPNGQLTPLNLHFVDAMLAGMLICITLLLCIFAGKFFNKIYADDTSSAIFAYGFVYQIIVLLAIIVFKKFAKFKFNFGFKLNLDVLKQALFYFLKALLFAIGLGIVINLSVYLTTGELPEKQDIIGLFSQIKSPIILLCAVFSVVILAPLMEELLFRCILYRSLMGLLCKVSFVAKAKELSAVVSAIIFAVAHDNTFACIPLFVIGLLLTSLYERTNSIVAPMICHGLFNLFNIALILAFPEV